MTTELTSTSPTPEELRAQYREALTIANDYFLRAEQIQRHYENYSVSSNTGSETRFPLIYQLTEELLPGLWFGLFPRDKMIRLSERWGSGADHERIRAAETYLHFLIRHSGLKREGLKTVKDAIKFGRGYGIVEMERVTVPEEIQIILANAATGEVETAERSIETTRYMPKYTYIDYPYVVPTPDGDSPENVSGVFVLRFYKEAEIIQMYEADQGLPVEHRRLKLSANEILQYTADHQLDAGVFDPCWILASIAGMSDRLARFQGMNAIIRQINNDRDRRKAKGRMLTVPVLQCKYHNQEYWLANGRQIMYAVDSGDKQVCMDVVSATANLDSGDWWAQGPVTAAGDLHDATNIVWRMLLDVVARAGDPVKLVNEMAIPNAPDDIVPGQTLKSRGMGDLRNAFTYVVPPPLPEGFSGLGAAFAEQASRTVGRPIQLSGQGGAGIMRGGSAAFETWLGTATGREKLMSSLIQRDWLVPTIDLIMRQAQLVMPARVRFSMGADGDPAEKRLHTITRKDFAREFDVEIDPDAKYNLSTQEQAIRLNRYNLVLKDNPDFDQMAVAEYALGDGPEVSRLRATPEVRERQMRELQERARREQEATQGAEMQGVEGGMARQAVQ